MVEEDELIYRPILHDRPKGRRIVLLGLLAGLVVAVLHLLFPLPTLTPELHYEAAIVEGLRPPSSLLPGLWRRIVGWSGTDVRTLSWLGALAAGFLAFILTLTFRYMLAMLVRPAQPKPAWTRRVAPVLATVAAVWAPLADPVWRTYAFLTPAGLSLLIFVAIVGLFIRWAYAPRTSTLCVGLFLLGLLASETPLAIAVAAGLVFAYFMVWRSVVNGEFRPLRLLPTPGQLPLWGIFFSLLLGLGVGFGQCADGLIGHPLFGVLDWPASQVLFRLVNAQVYIFWNAAIWPGWVMMVALVALPFVISIELFPRLTDEEYSLPFWTGVFLLFVGVAAYFQQGPFGSMRFWTWVRDAEVVRSQLLQALISLTATAAFVFVVGIFAFDAFCRGGRARWQLMACRAVLAVVAVGGTIFAFAGVPHREMCALLTLADDAVAEIVRECGDAERVFTDGVLDAPIERMSRRQGGNLLACSFVSGASSFETYLRQRGLSDRTDLESASAGASVLFAKWLDESPEKLARAATMVGLETARNGRWKRTLQPMSAFVARTGWTSADVADAVEIAARFASRLHALKAAAESPDVSASVRKVISAISWRLSRMARLREDLRLANALDEDNNYIRRLIGRMDEARMQAFLDLSPKENLALALRRANFQVARRYAEQVLFKDDRDASANFAMGMSFVAKGQMESAEPYLRRCLEVRPNDAAVLNNLSIICRQTRRFKEALAFAERAAKLLPNSPEVKRTLKAAQEAH